MSLRAVRRFSALSRRHGVWSEFSSRLPLLKVQNDAARSDLFNEIGAEGPASISDASVRKSYHSPVAIDEAFKSAYSFLENEAAAKYEALKNEDLSISLKNKLRTEAEEYNPEVIFNFENGVNVSFDEPVYRKLQKDKWKAGPLMVTMQRLEQHHMIPDTLPTVDPQVDVRIKFGSNTKRDFSLWVEPGTVLPAFAVAEPPTIEVQEFDLPEKSTGLYTVVLVNPDTPDANRNSFSTTLHYGLCNVPLDYVNNTITPGTLIKNPELIFQRYTPLTPEKNAPTQRACLWVFRQSKSISPEVNLENFDIRAFVEEHKLSAVGANIWRQHFDRSVEAVREKYGLPSGRVFSRERGVQPLV